MPGRARTACTERRLAAVVVAAAGWLSVSAPLRAEPGRLHVASHARRVAVSLPPGAQLGDTRPYHDLVLRAEALHGVSADLIHAVIRVESNYNPKAVSAAGAKGLMQLMPMTARSCGVRNAFDPAQSIFGGTVYLRRLAGFFQGDLVLTLAAYHAGPASVWSEAGVPRSLRTRAYVRAVLEEYASQRAARESRSAQLASQTLGRPSAAVRD